MDLRHGPAFEPDTDAGFTASGGSADQPIAPPEPAPSPCQWSLAKLLEGTQFLNTVMDDPNWKPSDVVGLLDMPASETGDELRENIRRKVDSIDYVVSEFTAYAKRLQARADVLSARATTAKRRAAGLLAYVQFEMERQGIQQLTGNERMIVLKRASNPECVTDRDPTEFDMLNLGEEFVRFTPGRYDWQKKELTKRIKAGEDFPFAKLEYSHSPVFDDADKPNVGERKRKGKK